MQRQPREPSTSPQSCRQVILGMLRSADSLYCSRTCTGRKWLGRTILPPKQLTACRLRTCKSSHALVALIHMSQITKKKKTNQKTNSSPNSFLHPYQNLFRIHYPFGEGTAVLAHNQVTAVEQVMARGEDRRNRSHAWFLASSKCKVIQLSLVLPRCKLNFCCLTFAWVNTTQTVS